MRNTRPVEAPRLLAYVSSSADPQRLQAMRVSKVSSYPRRSRRTLQRLEPARHDRLEPGQRITEEADLLPLSERTRPVVDGDLDGDVASAHELTDELPVEIESIACE